MKKGFTLLELIVVIIILGVLATLGFTQYGRMVEKARGAESRTILGDIRKLAIGFRLQQGTVTGFAAANANIGANADQIPNACRGTHYFKYAVTAAADPALTLTATRCTGGGKNPDAANALTLILTSDFTAGTDTFSGTGNY